MDRVSSNAELAAVLEQDAKIEDRLGELVRVHGMEAAQQLLAAVVKAGGSRQVVAAPFGGWPRARAKQPRAAARMPRGPRTASECWSKPWRRHGCGLAVEAG